MNTEIRTRLLFAAMLLAARLVPAAQNQFTVAEADGIKSFLGNPERKETNTVEVTRGKFVTLG